MAKKKTCFIIMPITTPPDLVETYSGGREHFKYVLEELFVPAVEAADLEAIRPISEGSEIIHGDIIKHIETADMLLCDMSSLNANVFFELGMRTAANKPVALVKDRDTPKAPFDLNIINHYTYSSTLHSWEMKQQIGGLKNHLQSCLSKIDEGNALWKYFSVTVKAEPLEEKPGAEAQFALINKQLEYLRSLVEGQREGNPLSFADIDRMIDGNLPRPSRSRQSLRKKVEHRIRNMVNNQGVPAAVHVVGPDHFELEFFQGVQREIPGIEDFCRAVDSLARENKMSVDFVFDE
ncbi:MAG: hypothetical protein QNJ30_09155 [Kiloniellales bacterium]|nr:hypothetical protein [Kiloniellales bacterium]